MPQECETRAIEARGSRNSCGGCFRDLFSPFALPSQFPIAAQLVQPDLGVLIVALVPRGGRS